MKQKLAVACIVLAAGGTPSRGAPVSWWRGEGNANDSIGANHGTLSSGTTFAPGVLGQAFAFDGIDDAVNISDSASLRLGGSLTLEATIKPTSYTGGFGGQIVFRGDDRPGFDPYFLRLVPDGRLEFGLGGEANAFEHIFSSVIPLGSFVHATGAFNAMSGRMELRVNGVTVASMTTQVRPLVNLQLNANPGVCIGNHSRYAPFIHNQPFHGVIDQVRIHDAFVIPGDSNYDGVVGLLDFNRLAGNFGQSHREWTDGDFTGDGVVNLADFNILAIHFGLGGSLDGPTPQEWAALRSTIPEPATALGLLPLLFARIRRAR